MTIPSETIFLGIAVLLFAIAGFCVTTALSPPQDYRSDATLVGVAVFLFGVALIAGLHP